MAVNSENMTTPVWFLDRNQRNQAEDEICWVIGLRDRYSVRASGFILLVRVAVCVVHVCVFGILEAEKKKKYAEHKRSERRVHSNVYQINTQLHNYNKKTQHSDRCVPYVQ